MIFKNARNDIAVLVADAPDAVALVTRGSEANWGIYNVSRPEFTRDWRAWTPTVHPLGSPEPVETPLVVALRKIVGGSAGITPTFDPGALDALALCFPVGDVCYFDLHEGFVHRFVELEDAELFKRHRGGTPIVFSSAKELSEIPREHLAAVAVALEAEAPTAKPKPTYFKELFEMAKKAKAKQTKKVAKVQARAKRADGPVAKARAIFDKASDPKNTVAMLESCKTAGIASATAKTQLYQWRKEKGIKADRGRPSTVKKDAKVTTKKKAGGKTKKKAAKEVEPAPAAAAPKATTKKKRVVIKKGQDPKAAHAAANAADRVPPQVEEQSGNESSDAASAAPGAVAAANEAQQQ